MTATVQSMKEFSMPVGVVVSYPMSDATEMTTIVMEKSMKVS